MKILVGYDGSRVSEDVVDLAQKHAKAFKADVSIMTSKVQGPELKKEDIDKAESKLENLMVQFTSKNISCEVHVSVSYLSPGEDLIHYAKNNDIDLEINII